MSVSPNSWGLSPRVRGNPSVAISVNTHSGSIPACAGEPCHRTACGAVVGVYPRVCGGTHRANPSLVLPYGLSPRVRGNRVYAMSDALLKGSIPACAGEPVPGRPVSGDPAVYPRVCGGTYIAQCQRSAYMGLSPRVRGNLHRGHAVLIYLGSIPACAGEPCGLPRRSSPRPVYPRVCGGTYFLTFSGRRRCGLSPRVRGNRLVTTCDAQR